MNEEEELKKGCGKKYVHSQGYDICGEHYGDGSVALCPNCSGKLEGFQKGKLEQKKEELEFLRENHYSKTDNDEVYTACPFCERIIRLKKEINNLEVTKDNYPLGEGISQDIGLQSSLDNVTNTPSGFKQLSKEIGGMK